MSRYSFGFEDVTPDVDPDTEELVEIAGVPASVLDEELIHGTETPTIDTTMSEIEAYQDKLIKAEILQTELTASRGVNQEIATGIESLQPGHLSGKCSMLSFTKMPSKTNYLAAQQSLEEISSGIRAAMLIALGALAAKIVHWIYTKFAGGGKSETSSDGETVVSAVTTTIHVSNTLEQEIEKMGKVLMNVMNHSDVLKDRVWDTFDAHFKKPSYQIAGNPFSIRTDRNPQHLAKEYEKALQHDILLGGTKTSRLMYDLYIDGGMGHKSFLTNLLAECKTYVAGVYDSVKKFTEAIKGSNDLNLDSFTVRHHITDSDMTMFGLQESVDSDGSMAKLDSAMSAHSGEYINNTSSGVEKSKVDVFDIKNIQQNISVLQSLKFKDIVKQWNDLHTALTNAQQQVPGRTQLAGEADCSRYIKASLTDSIHAYKMASHILWHTLHWFNEFEKKRQLVGKLFDDVAKDILRLGTDVLPDALRAELTRAEEGLAKEFKALSDKIVENIQKIEAQKQSTKTNT